jgi:hypothetical protein
VAVSARVASGCVRAAAAFACTLACGCWDYGFLGKSVCDTDPTALCEDFESGVINPSRWPMLLQTSGATVAVSPVRAHHGSFALDAKVPAGNLVTEAGVETAPSFVPNPSLFTRMWLYVPGQDLTLTGFVGTASTNVAAIAAGAIDGRVGTVNSLGNNTISFKSNNVFPVDRWACLELQIDTTPQRLTLFLDGQQVLAQDQQTLKAGDMQPRLGFGVLKFNVGPTPPGEVFVDDIVISFKGPIGCGP